MPKRALARHSGQAAHARTAQKTEQHRFGLIVTVLAGQQQLIFAQTLAKRLVTGIAGSLLDTGARSDLHLDNA
ncbi:hypothetical protein PsSCT_25430 [Pseudomonas sp. SCT]